MDNAACHFVFYTGPRKGEAQGFNTARISVGRSSGCDFRLEAFQLDQVAPQHAEVLLEDGNVYCLYDLNTKSGTFVNGERVHERCTLMHEDYIQFGQDGPEVIFRTGEPIPGKQPLPHVFPVTAELEFFSGSDAGRLFPIDPSIVTNIGRRADLEVPLDPRGDMIVSGNHCNIRYIDGHFVLTDSSRNGTYVNSELVDQPMEIIDGDAIMMGDGGPQARFHVDRAKRHYPNHRPLSPVVKKNKDKDTSAESAFNRNAVGNAATAAGAAGAAGIAGATGAGAAGAGAAAASMPPLASAKPYSSGNPLTGQSTTPPVSPSEQAPPEAVSENLAATPQPPADTPAGSPSQGHGSEFDAESVADQVEVDSTAAALAAEPTPDEAGNGTAQPAAPKKKWPPTAVVPALHKLKFKPGKKLIFGAIAIVILLGIIAMCTSGDDSSTGIAGRSDYETQLESLVPLTNTASGIIVSVPEGWTNLNGENTISAESRDKSLMVDYTRAASLSDAKVRQVLSANGAQVDANVEETTADGVPVKLYSASVGSVRRKAALHQPANGAPALALLETTEDTMEDLDDDVIEQLLVKNLALVGPGPVAPSAPATPAPAAPAQAATGTPALPTPSAATPAPVEQAAATPPPSDTPAGGPAITSRALKLTVTPPAGWTGISEEADAMLTLTGPDGVEIRVARDPGELDAKLTFDAMAKEGWKEDGRQTSKDEYKAGEFHRQDQNLMLVLIPEAADTTIVIYATSENDFTNQQRHDILNVIQQLASTP